MIHKPIVSELDRMHWHGRMHACLKPRWQCKVINVHILHTLLVTGTTKCFIQALNNETYSGIHPGFKLNKITSQNKGECFEVKAAAGVGSHTSVDAPHPAESKTSSTSQKDLGGLAT
jgi:hypothetical protein